MIAAFGGFHEDKGDTGLADLVPVDVALPFGHIDAVDRIAIGVMLAEINRLPVTIATITGRRQFLDIGLYRGGR